MAALQAVADYFGVEVCVISSYEAGEVIKIVRGDCCSPPSGCSTSASGQRREPYSYYGTLLAQLLLLNSQHMQMHAGGRHDGADHMHTVD